MEKNLKASLDEKVNLYNHIDFIKDDPVSIPHLFTKKQDIEIAGFFAAIFSWGNRTTIINKSKELLQLMDYAPHDFCLQHTSIDLKKLEGFKHRTFTATDLLYFIEFFNFQYSHHDSLEIAFTNGMHNNDVTIENGLKGFYNYFFSLPDIPERTKKHIASPEKNSSCKRLNMFLRWMVRDAKRGVDFGLWKSIGTHQLLIPLDVHVERTARELGLLSTPQRNWKSVLELTENLRNLDPIDPVKYDFALFGLSINRDVVN